MSFVRSKLKIALSIFLICIFLLSAGKIDKSGTVYSSIVCNDKKIALTFDDGPHPKITPKILDILAKYNVKATFFAIGVNIDNYPESIKRLVNEGHEIGIHTNSHCVLKCLDSKKIYEEIYLCKDKIYRLTNYQANIIRPPCGIYDDSLVKLAQENSLKIILWNIDTHDWAHMSANKIKKTVVENIKGGDIILFHDYISGENHNLEALENIIPILLKQGYEFVTISQLLQK